MTSATATTITDTTANFAVDALAGFTIQVVALDGSAQLRTIMGKPVERRRGARLRHTNAGRASGCSACGHESSRTGRSAELNP